MPLLCSGFWYLAGKDFSANGEGRKAEQECPRTTATTAKGLFMQRKLNERSLQVMNSDGTEEDYRTKLVENHQQHLYENEKIETIHNSVGQDTYLLEMWYCILTSNRLAAWKNGQIVTCRTGLNRCGRTLLSAHADISILVEVDRKRPQCAQECRIEARQKRFRRWRRLQGVLSVDVGKCRAGGVWDGQCDELDWQRAEWRSVVHDLERKLVLGGSRGCRKWYGDGGTRERHGATQRQIHGAGTDKLDLLVKCAKGGRTSGKACGKTPFVGKGGGRHHPPGQAGGGEVEERWEGADIINNGGKRGKVGSAQVDPEMAQLGTEKTPKNMHMEVNGAGSGLLKNGMDAIGVEHTGWAKSRGNCISMNKWGKDLEIRVGEVGMYTYHLPPRAPSRGKGNTSKFGSQAGNWHSLYMTPCKKIFQKVES
ncbi:hypothetical protein B0H10DRAFT_1970055 [Mycena sp. CBHHK59/15]|nr:hypothetical protein B0H10DRAFT_1970055 [Mycena sp. CBHHK59/15]